MTGRLLITKSSCITARRPPLRDCPGGRADKGGRGESVRRKKKSEIKMARMMVDEEGEEGMGKNEEEKE